MRILISFLFMLPLAAAASSLPDFPFVYVYGAASRNLPPERATITFRVRSYDADAEKSYQRQSDVAGTVVDFVEKLGIGADGLVGEPIEKTAVRREDDDANQLEILGYEMVRSVKLELADLSRFSELIEFLYSQSHIEDISAAFGRKDEASILQALTEDACRAAKANAQRLSAGFERKLGSVRAISESRFSQIGEAFGFPGESVGYASSAKSGFQTVPSTISYQKGVFAIFELE